MKKLITICLIIAATFTVNAQGSKPTKEQTLAYLTKTFKLTEGEIVINKGFNKYSYEVYEFSENKIIVRTKHYDWFQDQDRKDIYYYTIYSDLKWEDVISIKLISFDQITGGYSYSSDNLDSIIVKFSTKFKENSGDSPTYFYDELHISVIKSKAESFKKALERLVEIAKEENKNPFEK
ncbi:MAG: hypothetical protein RL308_1613 [Bacteroidota bacterium]|jgi:hypothetical protein